LQFVPSALNEDQGKFIKDNIKNIEGAVPSRLSSVLIDSISTLYVQGFEMNYIQLIN